MSVFTVEDLLTIVADKGSALQLNKVKSANSHVTIVTDVDVKLNPENDFSVNGSVLVCDSYDKVLSRYGSLKLDEFGDFRLKNIKVIFGTKEVTEEGLEGIFAANLIVRVTDVTDEFLNAITLRNRYAENLMKITVMTSEVE